MNLFNVYSLWPIEPIMAKGCTIWDKNGVEYTDLYGGHAVISIGHCHPIYNSMLQDQLRKLGFYSNSVQSHLQQELAEKLGQVCGYPDYSLFLCNSGAEANENALKLASFHTGRKKILAFGKSFHGRTSGAVAATDNPKIKSPFNSDADVTFVPLNDIESANKELYRQQYAATIIEGIQGVGGIRIPEDSFLQNLALSCKENGTLLILDEVQSGYGRTGKFFAHQWAGIRPDIITIAKGMANGFPIGGVLINPEIKAVSGMLGTTFGGNHLACTAALAVLKVIEEEHLIDNAGEIGKYLLEHLSGHKAFKEVRGRGLMIGLQLKDENIGLRERLLFEEHIFTGAAGKEIIRLLPPLCIDTAIANKFIQSLNKLTE